MDKNDTLTPQEKKDKNRSIVVITLLIAAVLLIADLYVMINMSTSYLALVLITVLLLVCVYFFINAILKEMQTNKQKAEEQYEDIVRSGKASYIMLKKALKEVLRSQQRMPSVFRRRLPRLRSTVTRKTQMLC